MKLLIIRLSSYGDILQALPCLKAIQHTYPQAQIDWVVREDASSLLEDHPALRKIHRLQRSAGWMGLVKLAWNISRENYTHIYDAHNNLRSTVLRVLCFVFSIFRQQPQTLVRSKNRWKRFLFFRLRRPVFSKQYRGSDSYLAPLSKWNISAKILAPPHLHFTPRDFPELADSFIALAPSAAWPNKRWPLDHWKNLITILNKQKFVILGGPQDTFCAELVALDPRRVINLAGKTSLKESCQIVKKADLLISADTGLLHAADQLGVKNIGLFGPTAFGYTSQPQSRILEIDLYCKPCSKDGSTPCHNPVYQKCMREITPQRVAQEVQQMQGSLL